MPSEKPSDGEPRTVRVDDIVTDLLGSDPNQLGGITLTGYIGPSKREGYIRLYRDLSFTQYLEVSLNDVLGSARLSKDEHAPSMLRVKASAEVVQVVARSDQARFLQGPITASHFRESAGPMGVVNPQTDPTWDTCPSCTCFCPTSPPCAQQPKAPVTAQG
jgi:hypothetical protein